MFDNWSFLPKAFDFCKLVLQQYPNRHSQELSGPPASRKASYEQGPFARFSHICAWTSHLLIVHRIRKNGGIRENLRTVDIQTTLLLFNLESYPNGSPQNSRAQWYRHRGVFLNPGMISYLRTSYSHPVSQKLSQSENCATLGCCACPEKPEVPYWVLQRTRRSSLMNQSPAKGKW